MQIEIAQLGGSPRREPAHTRGIVLAAVHPPKARPVLAANQADRLARRAHAHLDLGTDRDVANERRQRIRDEDVAFVAAVVANGVSQQTPRYADANLPAGRFAQGMVSTWHGADRV